MSEPVDYIALTRAIYGAAGYPPYQWAKNADPVELTRPVKPLAASRLALIASGGIHQAGHVAFHFRDDTSLRLIPRDVDLGDLRTAHFAYDQTDARADPGCVFPLASLRRLEELGEIGEIAPFALTFMGGIYSARRVQEELAPRVQQQLAEMNVDLALLVPV
jgi:D-proline reductase (dithiol) PrdB